MKISSILKPIITCCGIASTASLACCGGSTFNIEYGDNINCKDKTLNNFNSLDNIKAAIALKVNIETQEQLINIGDLNYLLANDQQFMQNIYYEFVAFHSIMAPDEFILADWKKSTDSQEWSFNYNGVLYQKVTFIYECDDHQNIKIGTVNKELNSFTSYTYQNCLARIIGKD